ncbi:MAG: glycosyltransferase family 4 protein [Rhizobiaceae bacterium]|uniref:glycosyltransferase family 4 protein n=1 Tax=Parvibaculum sp. TaxID=2024848 RepID=UPI001B21093B|nr:glycosyltransferase family 4 protein [Parvibaculum sp.]MBO6633394.1 glycosyltransferase family 4 protein [Parvibaculum sp.]MBO6725863.1 glycosyltransferase family 4 protein [Rhizobiaceae bacterium]
MRITHISTVHPRFDTRIFLKECAALRDSGFEVHLIVADGLGDETRDRINIHDVGRASDRLQRMTVLPSRAMRKARELAPSIAHFHDAELLPAIMWLNRSGIATIYDAHEDLPRAILSKQWLKPWSRRPVGFAMEYVEDFCARRMSAIVGATPHIARRFSKIHDRVVEVYNYPDLPRGPKVERKPEPATFCYVGAITRHRGIAEMVTATGLAGTRLLLAGRFVDARLEAEISSMPEWANVECFGSVDHSEIWKIMSRSQAGLLFFHPEPNHINAQPNKMFEYMAGGLPVLCSDFEEWQRIVSREEVGLVCNPLDAQAIANLMRELVDDPARAKNMGKRARQLIDERYRWDREAEKLVDLYRQFVPG